MIDAIAVSATADLLVWVTTAGVGATLAVVIASYRTIKRTERAVFGEQAVGKDDGVLGAVREHERRISANERALLREQYERGERPEAPADSRQGAGHGD